MTALKNQEKAVIVDALRDRYSLPILLRSLKLSRSSYYYQHKIALSPDKYEALRYRIKILFAEFQEDTAIAGFMYYWTEKAPTPLRKLYVQ